MPAKAVAIQISAFCASGRCSGFCVIIWLTCSGGILVGADGRGEDAQCLGRERVVPLAGVGGRAGFVTL